MASSKRDLINYLEPDDDGEATLRVPQLLNGTLDLENYPPIQELEQIKSDGNRALEMTQFSTPNEKKMAESLQRNTTAWIDTARDGLRLVIDVAGLAKTCAPAITADVLTPDDVARASQHAVSIGETLKRIYNRACDMAVNNSNDLLLAMTSNEDANQNITIRTAIEQHRDDLEKFEQGEVNVIVPYESHAMLLESIRQTGLDRNANVREKAEQSSRAWNIAKLMGTIVLAAGIIIGFASMKR